MNYFKIGDLSDEDELLTVVTMSPNEWDTIQGQEKVTQKKCFSLVLMMLFYFIFFLVELISG